MNEIVDVKGNIPLETYLKKANGKTKHMLGG